jgi:hypothetical protein
VSKSKSLDPILCAIGGYCLSRMQTGVLFDSMQTDTF